MKIATESFPLSRAWPGLLNRIGKRIESDDCLDLAAQISFYFSLSLLPFCLVLAVVVGRLPSTVLWRSFVTWIVTYLPVDSQRLIFSTILGLVDVPTGFFSLGLITAVWSASAGFMSLMESLSVIYAGRDSRSYWHKKAASVGVTLFAMLFALALFGVQTFAHVEYKWLSAEPWMPSHTLGEAARWIVTLAVLVIGIDLVNFVLPDVKRPWRWLPAGSVFVVLALILDSSLTNIYFEHFSSYPRIYGTLGGFIILMIWIYTTSVIVLIGAEVDGVLEDSEKRTRFD
jgi:membrane protein